MLYVPRKYNILYLNYGYDGPRYSGPTHLQTYSIDYSDDQTIGSIGDQLTLTTADKNCVIGLAIRNVNEFDFREAKNICDGEGSKNIDMRPYQLARSDRPFAITNNDLPIRDVA